MIGDLFENGKKSDKHNCAAGTVQLFFDKRKKRDPDFDFIKNAP